MAKKNGYAEPAGYFPPNIRKIFEETDTKKADTKKKTTTAKKTVKKKTTKK